MPDHSQRRTAGTWVLGRILGATASGALVISLAAADPAADAESSGAPDAGGTSTSSTATPNPDASGSSPSV